MSTNELHTSAISREVLEQIAGGDEQAFSFFYRHLYQELQPVRWRCIESGIDAAEVMQLTFIKAWLNREWLPEIQNLKAWTIKVAYREYLMAVRKKLNYEDKLEEYAAGPAIQNGAVTPFHVINYNELKRCVQEVIETLPPQRKTIYKLSRDEGLKTDEIARRLSISPNTVKSVLQTVLRQVKEKLAEAGYGPFAFLFFLNFSIS